jgi:hypothetical protein
VISDLGFLDFGFRIEEQDFDASLYFEMPFWNRIWTSTHRRLEVCFQSAIRNPKLGKSEIEEGAAPWKSGRMARRE